jgi:cell division protein FtsW
VLGIGTSIVLQAFLHMLVSVSLFPLTGQQLPIVSNGGSSLIVTLSMLGVLMNVSAKAEQEEEEKKLKESKSQER